MPFPVLVHQWPSSIHSEWKSGDCQCFPWSSLRPPRCGCPSPAHLAVVDGEQRALCGPEAALCDSTVRCF